MSAAAVPPGRLGFATGFALLVATGYVDAYTFLRHGHVFAEAVTGNFIFVGIGAFDPAIIAFWRPLLSILAFLLGVFVLSQAVRSERVVNAAPQIGALVIDVVVLAAAGALPRTFPQPVITSLIAFAAGAQNAAFRRIGSATVSTVVMTMNSTQIVGALLDALESRDRDALRRFQALFVALVGFLGGVLLGAWLSTVLHDRAAWVDAGLFLVAGWLYLEHDRRHRAGLPAAA